MLDRMLQVSVESCVVSLLNRKQTSELGGVNIQTAGACSTHALKCNCNRQIHKSKRC